MGINIIIPQKTPQCNPTPPPNQDVGWAPPAIPSTFLPIFHPSAHCSIPTYYLPLTLQELDAIPLSPAKITLTSARIFGIILAALSDAEVAQSVEQWTENPCVGSSILPLGILISHFAREVSLS